jgi:hypothetical protein
MEKIAKCVLMVGCCSLAVGGVLLAGYGVVTFMIGGMF